MKKIFSGTVKGDYIQLEKAAEIPNGTQAKVIVETDAKNKQDEIRNRQLSLIKNGFDLGGKFYSHRNELHER